MVSPVLGFLPVLPFRSATANVPKPEMFTLSPRFKATMMSSNRPLTMSSAFGRGSSARFAIESINSALVIIPHPVATNVGAMAVYNNTNAGCQTTLHSLAQRFLLRQNLGSGRLLNFIREGRWIFFGLRLHSNVPKETLGIIRDQRFFKHVIHMRDQGQFNAFQNRSGNLFNIFFVLRRDQDSLD